MAKGAALLNPHVPSPSPPVTPTDLFLICHYLDQAPTGGVLKAAISIGFFAFLRKSNLLSPSATMWRGPHTLLRRDVVSTPQGLYITLRSSKTIKPGMHPVALMLPRIPGSTVCPAQAWDNYIALQPLSDTQPAFMTPYGQPLTPDVMVGAIQAALLASNCPNALLMTAHSLRRGGVHAASQAGCTKEEIAVHPSC